MTEIGEVIEQVATRYDTSRDMKTIKTRGGTIPYLGVKGRVAWLRAEHPDAEITTEKVDGGVEAGWVEFRCLIRIPGGGVASGYASETHQDFPDFYEKAETKAIGRACALLGYGTEGARDFDDGEPLDGAAASKGERADRRMEPHERAAVDEQHARNTTPPPMKLPATRGKGGTSEPNGVEMAKQRLIADAAARGVTLEPDDTPGMWADDVDAALEAAAMEARVIRNAEGTPMPRALSNALLALPEMATAGR
jgi:hypothetical protein